MKLGVAGKALTDYMQLLVSERKLVSKSKKSAETVEVMKQLKEMACYVAQDYETELNESQTSNVCEETYELMDGSIVTIGSERFRCPEALFQPSLIGLENATGVHDTIYQAIQKCDPDIKKDLFANVVLTGGSTMFRQIEKRLKKEIESLAPKNANVSVFAPASRKNSVWTGGAILASLFAQKQWVNRTEYAEYGVSIIHKKCF